MPRLLQIRKPHLLAEQRQLRQMWSYSSRTDVRLMLPALPLICHLLYKAPEHQMGTVSDPEHRSNLPDLQSLYRYRCKTRSSSS